jgi:hypothetical protein
VHGGEPEQAFFGQYASTITPMTVDNESPAKR